MSRILLVITRLDAGGSAELTLQLARGLSEVGHQVDLITGESPNSAYDFKEYAQKHNFNIIVNKYLKRDINPFYDFIAFILLLKVIKNFKPHILHTNTSKAGFLGRLAGYLSKVPKIVHSDHGHIFYGYYTPALTYFFVILEKLAAHWCHLILTLTESGKKDYINLKIGKPEQFRISYGGVNLARFSNLTCREPHLPSSQSPLRIIWVGRIVPIKNLPLLLKAALILNKENFPAEYWIVGEGEEKLNCQSLADEWKLKNLTFWGYRDDVPQLMAQSDLFVFTSLNEGFGLVIVEAMACGLPVVGPAVGGTPDLIENGKNGYLIQSDNAQELADRIITLAYDLPLRVQIRLNNQKKAENFSINSYIKRIMTFYFN